MNDGALMTMEYGARDASEGMRVEGSKRQAYPQPDALTVAASAAVVAAVVVERDPEARTGSRRSMMTDDSRPSRPHVTLSSVLQRVVQVFLYGNVKTLPK